MTCNDQIGLRAGPFFMFDNEVLFMGGNRSSLMVLLVVLGYSDEMIVFGGLLTFRFS